MVPPRGCAYVVMVNREDAAKVVEKKATFRLYGNALKVWKTYSVCDDFVLILFAQNVMTHETGGLMSPCDRKLIVS